MDPSVDFQAATLVADEIESRYVSTSRREQKLQEDEAARGAPPVRKSHERLDMAMVSRGLVETRARAKDLIVRGAVRVDGVPSTRPARPILPEHVIELDPAANDYVSRGALKLTAALDQFGFDATDRICLDVGASTGGFTEVLLRRGALKVYAVENGTAQLHPRLAADPRVVSLERTDARSLDAGLIPEPIGAIVADVSFISLTKALPAALTLAVPGCWLAVLVKPQFELGPGLVPRDGIVKSAELQERALASVVGWLSSQHGWSMLGTMASPITGSSGNSEFLIGGRFDGGA